MVCSMSRKNRILIVDDEELIVELLENYFQSLNYEVASAESAETAIHHLQNGHAVDLIITDINLPGKSGIELLQIVRQLKPEVPVVLITGHKTLDFAISAIKNGATDFITKPFDLSNVRKVVEKILRFKNQSREREKIYEFVKYIKLNFEYPTNQIDPGIIANHLASMLLKAGFCAESEYNQYYLAFTETLVNAIEHGNLELSSNMKGSDFEKIAQFEQLREERLKDPRYGERKVFIAFEFNPELFSLNITDEGPGFDWRKYVSTNKVHALNLKAHGRGFVFIRNVMDEVYFNEKGNSITLIKHRN